MIDDADNINPLADPGVRAVNGKVAALQSRIDQVSEGLRLNRTAITFLHENGLAETERTIGRELTVPLIGMLSAWAFASLELADMRAAIDEAELLTDEIRRRKESEGGDGGN